MRMSSPPSLYQQTTLDVDPAFHTSVVDLCVPPSTKRRRIDSVTQDEETFSRSLASEAFIHFRTSSSHYPRSILCRVLENRKVLELQAVDLRQDGTKAEALLTLRFAFTNQIKKGGLAFIEGEREGTSDAFVVFVPTVAGELFTLTLRREAFIKSGCLDENGRGSLDWCRSAVPNAFTFRTPFKLLAKSETELWASLDNGSLVKLERQTESV